MVIRRAAGKELQTLQVFEVLQPLVRNHHFAPQFSERWQLGTRLFKVKKICPST